jgi:hypothetical protein
MFPEVIERANEGIRLLGTPIGSEVFIREHARRKVEETLALMNKIKDLQNPQLELILLRSCASFPKINFLLRTVDALVIDKELRAFDMNDMTIEEI